MNGTASAESSGPVCEVRHTSNWAVSAPEKASPPVCSNAFASTPTSASSADRPAGTAVSAYRRANSAAAAISRIRGTYRRTHRRDRPASAARSGRTRRSAAHGRGCTASAHSPAHRKSNAVMSGMFKGVPPQSSAQ